MNKFLQTLVFATLFVFLASCSTKPPATASESSIYQMIAECPHGTLITDGKNNIWAVHGKSVFYPKQNMGMITVYRLGVQPILIRPEQLKDVWNVKNIKIIKRGDVIYSAMAINFLSQY